MSTSVVSDKESRKQEKERVNDPPVLRIFFDDLDRLSDPRRVLNALIWSSKQHNFLLKLGIENRLIEKLDSQEKDNDSHRYETFLYTDKHDYILERLAAMGHDAKAMTLISDPDLLSESFLNIAGDVLIRLTPQTQLFGKLLEDYNFESTGSDGTGLLDMVPERGHSGNKSTTLITTLFRAEDFLQIFLENAGELDNYNNISHHFIGGALSDEEISTLVEHADRFPNVYITGLPQDPGLYECWNHSILMAATEYVSNANVDDLRAASHVQSLEKVLDAKPNVMVAACPIYPFENFVDPRQFVEHAPWYTDDAGSFGFQELARVQTDPISGQLSLSPHNIPHCMPVWRKDIHSRFGFFNEEKYGTYADWAFWLLVFRTMGQVGWVHSGTHGFYFINPHSHNRRYKEHENWHRVIEEEFLDDFLGGVKSDRSERELASRSVMSGEDDIEMGGKLKFATGAHYGLHRNRFDRITESLLPLSSDSLQTGTKFIPFIEKYFVWGEEDGEAKSSSPQPLREPWIGILHVPFDTPKWFEPEQRPERFMCSALWRSSQVNCKGIICLSRDLERSVSNFLPALNVSTVLHPTEFEDCELFDFERFLSDPRIVQVGDWLRRMRFAAQISAPGYKKLMLMKEHTGTYISRENAIFGACSYRSVDLLDAVSNEEYDAILASSVVVMWLYGTSANNAVLECLARATPLLINPLPAVVEYLGRDYPGYISDHMHVSVVLNDHSRIKSCHQYLLERRKEFGMSRLTYEAFCKSLESSSVYQDL